MQNKIETHTSHDFWPPLGVAGQVPEAIKIVNSQERTYRRLNVKEVMIDIVYDAALRNVTPLTLPSTNEGQLEYGASLNVRGEDMQSSQVERQAASSWPKSEGPKIASRV